MMSLLPYPTYYHLYVGTYGVPLHHNVPHPLLTQPDAGKGEG